MIYLTIFLVDLKIHLKVIFNPEGFLQEFSNSMFFPDSKRLIYLFLKLMIDPISIV